MFLTLAFLAKTIPIKINTKNKIDQSNNKKEIPVKIPESNSDNCLFPFMFNFANFL